MLIHIVGKIGTTELFSFCHAIVQELTHNTSILFIKTAI